MKVKSFDKRMARELERRRRSLLWDFERSKANVFGGLAAIGALVLTALRYVIGTNYIPVQLTASFAVFLILVLGALGYTAFMIARALYQRGRIREVEARQGSGYRSVFAMLDEEEEGQSYPSPRGPESLVKTTTSRTIDSLIR